MASDEMKRNVGVRRAISTYLRARKWIAIGAAILAIIILGVTVYVVLVGARFVCEDFGPLDSDTITMREGIAYIRGTNTPFSGVVRDSGCGQECESLFLCPNPTEVLTYADGKFVSHVKRW